MGAKYNRATKVCAICPLNYIEGKCVMGRGRRCWLLEWIAPPVVITTVHAVVYLLQVLLGVYVINATPSASVVIIGSALTVWWAWMCIVGGALGFLGCVPGVWWLEKVGLLLVGSAAVIQLVVLSQAPRSPGHATALLCFVALMWVRWMRIKASGLDPARRRFYLHTRPPHVTRGA